MKRELEELFEAKLRKLWNDLEIRALVLVSLFLQIFLIASGNRRKYIRKKWVSVMIWLSYLSADAVATIALGVLSRAEGNDEKSNSLGPSYTIMAFWAPFLLMHLGGPDTITAYALADNELWARHLLGLLTQVGFAVYILFRSWNGGTPLNLLWMVVFFAGLIKYGERTWVLFSVSKDRFRESFMRPDPGPNYVRFTAQVVSREREGYIPSLDQKAKETVPSSLMSTLNIEYAEMGFDLLQVAYSLFGTFKQLFADLIVGPEDGERSLSLFMQMAWEEAFRIVEVELGLVYDLFYTKAYILYSLSGFFLRLLSISTTIAAFVSFAMIDKNVYPRTEVIIAYTLLVGAISLEIYAIMSLLSSERIVIWLTGDSTNLPAYISKLSAPIFKFVSVLRCLGIVPSRTRWSNAMGQYNALDYFLEGQSRCSKVHFYLEKYLFWKCVSVPKGLKALIFDELIKHRARSYDKNKLDRGDQILLKRMNFEIVGDDKNHEVAFDQSILLWHMATDFCYREDVKEEVKPHKLTWLYEFIPYESSSEENLKFKREICNMLSKYMMYLFIMSPLMLPSGIGQIRFLDTRAQAIQFFGEQKFRSKRDACKKILEVNTPLPQNQVEGNKSKSVFFDACRLAKSLELPDSRDRKWEIITQAWLDILIFAAAQCQWNYHTEKLGQGGELLTHVWLLISHLGMTDQVLTEPEYPSRPEVDQA